jgi:hypothetical protein
MGVPPDLSGTRLRACKVVFSDRRDEIGMGMP